MRQAITQTTTTISQDGNFSPEKALLIAILERAALDAHRLAIVDHVEDADDWRRKARAWLLVPPTSIPKPFTFQWVCESLDLEPSTTRRKILNYKITRLAHQKTSRRWLNLAGQLYDNDYRNILDCI